MKYLDELRERGVASALAAHIKREVQPERNYRFMEFCGGHTHVISRFGLCDLLPPEVQLIHGPGCPVCVLPASRIDMAVQLAQRPGVTLCTYADTLRIPAGKALSLQQAKAAGADVRSVRSPAEALQWARELPEREVVFMGIGFETTTPPTALLVQQAAREQQSNLSVLCNHVLTPAAMQAIVDDPAHRLGGLIGPAHVSVITGSAVFEPFARQHGLPVAIAGFEPADVLRAVQLLVRQVNSGRAEVENEFTRAVTHSGNVHAQAAMHEVFETRPAFEWRGLGMLPDSGLRIRAAYRAWDAETKFDLHEHPVADHKACDCAAVLRGVQAPQDCRIFGSACTPEHPLGACMVSSEGACAAAYHYAQAPSVGRDAS